MRILHIICSIARHTGGPARSSQGLVAALQDAGIETALMSCIAGESPWHSGIKHFFVTEEKNTYSGLLKAIEKVVTSFNPDLIHIHTIWTLSSHVAAVVARKMGIPYVISPRGMLEPWSLNVKKWKKRFALWLYQRHDLRKAVALHATAESEGEQFWRLGFKQPIIVLPNAVDFPDSMPPRVQRAADKRTVLFLSRIHPKKGLIELVEAWAKLKGTFQKQGSESHGTHLTRELSRWHFEYAGPDCEGHLAVVQRRILELRIEADFTYLGDMDDSQKWDAFSSADIFILPTYSENFGIVVVEALAAGLPVITTKGAPWAELITEQCGWWVDIAVDSIAQALSEAMLLTDEQRRVMGGNGRRLVEKKYIWPAIAEQMKIACEWVLKNGKRPMCIFEHEASLIEVFHDNEKA